MGSSKSYAQAALNGECERVAKTGSGGRTVQLNASAFSVGQLIGPDSIAHDDAERRLVAAAEHNGLIADDGIEKVLATIRSGLKAGEQNPRHVPGGWSTDPRFGNAARRLVDHPRPQLAGVALSDWTSPEKDGRPLFQAIGAPEPPKQPGEIRRHLYRRDGVAVRCKLKKSDGTYTDWYQVRRPTDGALGWQCKRPQSFVPVPYVGTASPFDCDRVGDVLVWTEGEKDTDTLAALNIAAFSFGGATDVPPRVEELLHGRDVVVLGDNDIAGRDFVSRVVQRLGSARTVVFEELGTGGDVTDWFGQGHTVEEFWTRINEAEVTQKSTPRRERTPDPSEMKCDGEPRRQEADRSTLSHQGLLVAKYRDRLDVAPSLDAAHQFPTASLPPLARDMVRALVEHVQAPESLCAHSVLSAMTLVSQGLADIVLPSIGRPLPLSLFMLAIAASGERKSTCDAMALRGVAEFEEALQDPYDEQVRRYRADKAAFDGEVSKIKSERKIVDPHERQSKLRSLIEPKEPAAPILRAEEPNLEGLLNLLVHGRPSIGVFTAEGGSFIGGHGMNEDAKTRTFTGLSRLYDSGSAQRVRAKELTIIKGCRVSISIAVQAKIASALLGDELAQDQGFLGRFLVCCPESTIGTREVRAAASQGDTRVRAFVDRTRRLLELQETMQAPLRLPSLQLDDIAWQVWQAFAQSIENDLGKGGIWWSIRATAQRMAENIARLAGILHVFCEGQTDKRVAGETMAAACDIGRFYLREALRIGGGVITDPETQAVSDLACWLESRADVFTTPSLIQQTAPRPLRLNAKTTRSRIRTLCEAGILELVGERDVNGRHYREVYRIIRGGR